MVTDPRHFGLQGLEPIVGRLAFGEDGQQRVDARITAHFKVRTDLCRELLLIDQRLVEPR